MHVVPALAFHSRACLANANHMEALQPPAHPPPPAEFLLLQREEGPKLWTEVAARQ